MKIALLTIGTRGDVQPYIALGKELQARGHDVVLAAPDNFADWVSEHGLAFHGAGVDMQALLQTPEAKRAMAGNPFAFLPIWRRTVLPMIRASMDATWAAARDADVIVFHPKANGAVDVAEATSAALVYTAPLPLFPTGAFPFFALPGNYGRRLNRLTYGVLQLPRLFFRGLTNRWRADSLGLGPARWFAPLSGPRSALALSLCAVSPALLPRPYAPDDRVHATGPWLLDEGRDWQPDAGLATFLAAGPPPVYIGFGSMTTQAPDKLARAIVDGVLEAGVRAVVATGWGGLDRIAMPASIHVIDAAPHDTLFPRMAAVVHHGGAGTIHAGLRAGRPTLVCPLGMDQPFWGRRVHALGCGPPPLPLRRLKATRFAAGLRDLTSTPAYRSNAAAIAQAMANDGGALEAADLIEALA